jgi:serine/threonine-protein kinase
MAKGLRKKAERRPPRKKARRVALKVERKIPNGSGRGPVSSNVDLRWEFWEELSGGGTPDWDAYLRRCERAVHRRELLDDMISTECEHAGWDSGRIKNRLKLYTQHDKSKTGRLSVVRGLYKDCITSGANPSRETIKQLGLPLGALELRARDERVFLGQTIGGRYRLEQVLGIGGFAVVYLATDLKNRRFVAVKTLRGKETHTRQKSRSLLQEEARVLDVLRHTGIPEFVGRVDDKGAFSIVLAYIEGGTLWELAQQGRLAPKRGAKIVAAVAGALDFAHRKGYIHRDLKLANVLIDKADRPYLADYGLVLSNADQFDREGESGGTFGFMPVESLMGMTSQMDGRADIWSAGVMLFELLTGKQLMAGSCREEAFVEVVVLERRKLKYPKDVPPVLRKICEKCLARDPNQRYHTAGLLRSALHQYLAGEPNG